MTHHPFHRAAAALALATGLSLAVALPAQAAWPNDKTIQIIVPYAPGGTADALARLVAEHLGPKLGTTTMVLNKAGASGTLGEAEAARAAADGYTLLYTATPFSINPHLQKLPYDPKDLQPVTQVAVAPMFMAVGRSSPYKTLAELTKAGKQAPGKLNFSSGGQGTVQYMGAELMLQALGVKATHVPYKSGGPALQAIMAGEVDFGFGNVSALAGHVKGGLVRPLAITSAARNPNYADVPTLAESGVKGYEVHEWNGIFVPAGTPPETVQRLNTALREVLESTAVKARIYALGARVVASPTADFQQFLAREGERWGATVKAAGIRKE